jgi:hypothetical protein
MQEGTVPPLLMYSTKVPLRVLYRSVSPVMSLSRETLERGRETSTRVFHQLSSAARPRVRCASRPTDETASASTQRRSDRASGRCASGEAPRFRVEQIDGTGRARRRRDGVALIPDGRRPLKRGRRRGGRLIIARGAITRGTRKSALRRGGREARRRVPPDPRARGRRRRRGAHGHEQARRRDDLPERGLGERRDRGGRRGEGVDGGGWCPRRSERSRRIYLSLAERHGQRRGQAAMRRARLRDARHRGDAALAGAALETSVVVPPQGCDRVVQARLDARRDKTLGETRWDRYRRVM